MRSALRVSVILFGFCAMTLFPTLAASAPKVVEKTMARSVLNAVIAKGPQRLIATLQVQPHMVKGRFMGYRLMSFSPDSPLVNSDTVRPGDVIVSVNKERIERPEQFMRAWEVVANTKSLKVTILRGLERIEYRWRLQ